MPSSVKDQKRALRLGLSDSLENYEPLSERQFTKWWSQREGVTPTQAKPLWEAYILGYGSPQYRRNPNYLCSNPQYEDESYEWDFPAKVWGDSPMKTAFFKAAGDADIVEAYRQAFIEALRKQGFTRATAKLLADENVNYVQTALWRVTNQFVVPKPKKKLKVPKNVKVKVKPGMSKLVTRRLKAAQFQDRLGKFSGLLVKDLSPGVVVVDSKSGAAYVVGELIPNQRNTVDIVLTKLARVYSGLAERLPAGEEVVWPRKRASTPVRVETERKTSKVLVDEDLYEA